MSRRCTILILLLLGTMCSRLPAPLYQDGYSDTDAKALAANYSSSIGRLSLYDSVGPFDGSAVFLNSRWCLTAAHNLVNPFGAGDASISGINQGSTPDGQLLIPIATFVYPGYDQTGNAPDLALIRIDGGVAAARLVIASVSSGEIVTSAGFGIYGAPSIGLFQQDSNSRGWQAAVAPDTFGGYSSVFYQSTFFAPDGLHLNGRGLSGDSGSPVFNGSGQLVGINVAAGGGLSAFGHTEFLRLTQPEVYGWIQSIITPVEPQIVRLAPEGFDLRLTWQGKGGSNYVVQAASALGGTNTFTDLSAPILLPGVGPVLTNFLDVGVMTNHTTRFYRLRLQ